MNERIRKAIDRLKESVNDLEKLDSSYWNKMLGTGHLNAYADQILNDAKTLSSHIKNY